MQKSKKKMKLDEKLISQARPYIGDAPKSEIDNDAIDPEKLRLKEIKREKMRLKRQKKKEEKAKQFKKRQTDEFAKSAISYLYAWKDNRDSWNFKKNLQMWLLDNMYDDEKVSNNDFELLLLYMQESKGAVRQRTVEQAESIIDSWDNRDDEVEVIKSSVKSLAIINESCYERARNIVQTLI